MKKRDFQLFVFFMIVWIALNERIAPFTLVLGVLCSIYSLVFINRFLKVEMSKEFDVNPWKFIYYCFYIIKEIYLAGFDMFARILKGEVSATFIEYKSDLKSDLANVVLANSITSTPGTITVHRDKGTFIILSANPDSLTVTKGIKEGMEPEIKMFDERQAN